MALIQCRECGQMVSDKAAKCPKCGCPIVRRPVPPVQQPQARPQRPQQPQAVQPQPAPQPVQPQPAPQVVQPQPKPQQPVAPSKPVAAPQQAPVQSSSHWKAITITVCVVLLLICGGVGGYFYYNNFYLPKKIDKEAPRYYTFGNLMLRSSQIAGVDYNKIAMLPYGTKFITYSHGAEWSKVKVDSADPNAPVQEGYVASPYILDEKDFFLLNSIFADTDSRDAIPTAKCKLALLWYYKKNGYIGNLSVAAMEKLGIDITPTNANQWQVSVRVVGNNPNEVFYKKLMDRDSKYNDFAVIIKNIKNGDRKLLYFYFDDDENFHFFTEQEAPREGEIKNIVWDGYGGIEVIYS